MILWKIADKTFFWWFHLWGYSCFVLQIWGSMFLYQNNILFYRHGGMLLELILISILSESTNRWSFVLNESWDRSLLLLYRGGRVFETIDAEDRDVIVVGTLITSLFLFFLPSTYYSRFLVSFHLLIFCLMTFTYLCEHLWFAIVCVR